MQTALSQDMTAESETEKQTVPVLLKGMVSKEVEPTANEVKVASTIMARDYKGLSNYGTNGVIECK